MKEFPLRAFLLVAYFVCMLPACARTPVATATAAEGLADGDYYILAKNSYKPITAIVTGDGEFAVQQLAWSSERDGGQIWSVKRDEHGYTMRSKKFGRYLAIPGASQETGAAVEVLADDAGRAQRWTLLPYLDSHSLVAVHSGQALSVNGGFREDGANYLQWEAPTHANNGQFLFVPAGAGDAGRHALPADPLAASRYDNAARRYRFAATVPGVVDGDRLRHYALMDYQPTGLYVKHGEVLRFSVSGLDPRRDALVAMIGPANAYFEAATAGKPQEQAAHPGANELVASRSGVLYFRYVDSGFGPTPLSPVDVEVQAGGQAMPFYLDGQTTAAQWRAMLDERPTPYIEMVGPRALISVRRDMYEQSRQLNPSLLLRYLARMIGYHDDISGLDGRSAVDAPSPLRLHYLQDDVSSPTSTNDVYMYAGDHFIGMPGDSPLALLNDPAQSDPWAVWHEAGHIYQQSDWTWDEVVEVTVNIYSLHAQQRFGLPSRIAGPDPDTGMSSLDWALRYLAQDERNYLDSSSFPDDSSGWARLVMFEQLRQGLGDGFYQDLHKYYRRHPLDAAQRQDKNTQVQQFILRSCIAAKLDLSAFFDAWGLAIDQDTADAIARLSLPAAPDLTGF